MLVMMAMMGRPPEGSFLCRCAAKKREAKLKEPARLVAAMREIAMKGSRDAKFTDEKHESAERRSLPVDAGPKYGETRHVDHDEKNTREGNTKTTMHRKGRLCSKRTGVQLKIVVCIDSPTDVRGEESTFVVKMSASVS